MCKTKQRLDGKLAVVTGSSSGIGLEGAKQLAKLGARVILASRNETKLKKARNHIMKASGNKNVTYKVLDLASFKSVRNFAKEIIHSEKHLDVFVSNAGSLSLPDSLSEDGLNLTMQVNYFGSFLLAYLLLPLLKASAPSRMVKEQASSMFVGRIDFDHWHEAGHPRLADIANSKLASALFHAELVKRLKGNRVTVNSYDPFAVGETEILRNFPEPVKRISGIIFNTVGQPKEDVGDQIAYLAADPAFENISGKHYMFCREFFGHWLENDALFTKKVWEMSKKLVGISPEEDWELSGVQ